MLYQVPPVPFPRIHFQVPPFPKYVYFHVTISQLQVITIIKLCTKLSCADHYHASRAPPLASRPALAMGCPGRAGPKTCVQLSQIIFSKQVKVSFHRRHGSVATKAKVHGVVTSVSPMKQAATTQFFDATLVDNDSEIRVVGFSPILRKRLADYKLKKDSLMLNNCKIKKAKYSEDLEILLNPRTEISLMPKR